MDIMTITTQSKSKVLVIGSAKTDARVSFVSFRAGREDLEFARPSNAAVREEAGWHLARAQWGRQDFLQLWLPVCLPCQSAAALVLSSSVQVCRRTRGMMLLRQWRSTCFWVVGVLEQLFSPRRRPALALHWVFCSFVARAWTVRASWSGGSPVLGQRGGIIISNEIWPRPFGGL